MSHVDISSSSKEVHQVPCPRCNRDTNHKVLTSVVASDSSPDNDIHVSTYFETVQCLGCNEISFRKNWHSSEDYETSDDGQYSTAIDHPEYYPPRLSGRQLLKDHYLLPERVLPIYQETHAALCNASRILAGIGIRAIVEAVCSEKNATGNNLERRIDNLVTQNVLSPPEAELLHRTRLLGNEAAHEVMPLGGRQLAEAMDVAEHLLNTVYLIPQTTTSLPRRGP